ncbi:MAG: molybdopterin-guanine dinucleotide biosynthesis protein MobB [Synergistaceae bacterium]|nr:molybdopterin-guanine dinucleotide biosynthesis protein MobB [Synergistaceae bacterium]
MRIIAVSGYKDSGKSTLCRKLLRIFAERGLKTGYIKRTREFVGSPPDTDSGAACAEGTPTLLWGDASFRYETNAKNNGVEDAYDVAGKFFPDADIVILEGGKKLELPKIWVLRPNEALPEDAGIFAAYDRYGSGDGARRYGESETERLAFDMMELIEKNRRRARVYIGNHELPMKDFVADFVAGGVRGMLGALKKTDEMGETGSVRIYIGEEWSC